MEKVITWEKLVPDAYNDKTELSDNQIDAHTKELPIWVAGIVLENVPKCFATIVVKTWPVVGIVVT
jgi:hypothetical protein